MIDLSDILSKLDSPVLKAATRASAGMDSSVLRAATRASTGMDSSVLRAATRASTGMDSSVLRAATRAAAGIDSSVLRAATRVAAGMDSSVLRAATRAAAGMDSSVLRAAFDNSLFRESNALRAAFNNILDLKNLSTDTILDDDWLGGISDSSVEEVYEEVAEEIAQKKDFNLLSPRSQGIVLIVLSFFFTTIIDVVKGLATNEIYAHLTKANTILPSKSAPEIKAIARGKSTPEFDRSMIKGFRVVVSEGLYFRDEPRMKSEIITILKRGTSLEVVDDSNRTWIQVAVTIDGEEELGWVSKRYTVLIR